MQLSNQETAANFGDDQDVSSSEWEEVGVTAAGEGSVRAAAA